MSPVLLALCACGLFLGTDEQLSLALVALERAPPTMEVLGATFQPTRFVLTRQVREVHDRRSVTVRAHADADGDLAGVAVRYLGPETLRLVRTEGTASCAGESPSAERGGWVVDGPALPNLREILATLRARRLALEQSDAASYTALVDDAYFDRGVDRAEVARRIATLMAESAKFSRLPARAWLIRAERDVAQVREEYDVEATPGKRPLSRMAALLTLRRRGNAWRFAAGLY